MPNELPKIVDGSTNASMAGKGSFVVGTLACFFFSFYDENAMMFDPSNIEAVITDFNNSEVETITSGDKLELGMYVLTWNIGNSITPGKYTITLTYTVETSSGPVDRTFTENFVVSETGAGVLTYRSAASRAFLETLILEAQHIPVFHEPARLNNARTIAELTFPRWNQKAGVKILINNEFKESGFSIDYDNGKVIFNNPLSSYDYVLVSYNFRWFTDEELDQFVEQGIQMFNLWPPQSVYNIVSIPDRFLGVGVYWAAVLAIRRLLFGLNYQQPVKIYGSIERAQQVQSNLTELKKEYEDWVKMMLEVKKYGPYPSTRTVTTPIYTLPGSRSRFFRYLFKT